MSGVLRLQYANEIKDLPECSADTLDWFVSRRVSCVVRGMAKRWPAVKGWSLDYLRREGHGVSAQVARLNQGNLGLTATHGVDLYQDDIGAFIDRLLSGDNSSYLMTRLEPLKKFNQDTPTPNVCHNAPWHTSKLWVSPKGTVSPLHFDVADNIHVQVLGQKKFLVMPVSDSFRLYPHSPLSSTPNLSRVDPLHPDFERFPLLQKVQRWQGVLQPGDAVFLPGFVWHHVTTVDTSVSVNFWWARGPLRLAAWAANSFKRLRAIHQ